MEELTLDYIGSHLVQVFIVYLGLVVLLDAFVYTSEELLDLRLLVYVHYSLN